MKSLLSRLTPTLPAWRLSHLWEAVKRRHWILRFCFLVWTEMGQWWTCSMLVFMLCTGCHGDGARILGIFPSPSFSHHLVFQEIMKALVARGHQVTVISTDPLKVSLQWYAFLALRHFHMHIFVLRDLHVQDVFLVVWLHMHQLFSFFIMLSSRTSLFVLIAWFLCAPFLFVLCDFRMHSCFIFSRFSYAQLFYFHDFRMHNCFIFMIFVFTIILFFTIFICTTVLFSRFSYSRSFYFSRFSYAQLFYFHDFRIHDHFIFHDFHMHNCFIVTIIFYTFIVGILLCILR
jgi:hypothetical protein